MKGRSMTEGAPWKHILRFAMPVLAGLLLQQLYNTVDTIVVGRFAGEASLSAVGTTVSFVLLFLAVAVGLSTGCGVIIAQRFGAGDEQQVHDNAATGVTFLLLLGLLATVIGIAVSRPAFTGLVHVPDSFLDLTLRYFRIYALGLVFQYGYNIFSFVLRAIGDSAATLIFLLIASVLNIGLDILFVGSFHWGVAGAAVATDISQAASFVAAYFYMTRKYPVFRFRLSEYRIRPKLAGNIARVGFPVMLQLVVVSSGLTLIQRAANEFGQAMTATFTIVQRMEVYLLQPASALQTTMATYTGQNIGAGRIDRVKKGALQTAAMSVAITVIAALLCRHYAATIVSFFGLSGQAAEYSREAVRAVALLSVLLSAYITNFGVFQGSKHAIAATAVAMTALGLRSASVYLFRFSPLFGKSIIWWNGLFGFTAGFMITWSIYLSGWWKKNAEV